LFLPQTLDHILIPKLTLGNKWSVLKFL